ncbi:MFS transporter, partial [Deltaproteobacteria bacterium OttesenSCG-928-K17]|nr:MFS transporter [Deltaproteobacteria bacterium OttesenSCG-928-K17]
MRIYIWFPVLTSLSLGFTFMNIPPLGPQFMGLMGIGYDGLSILLSGLFWSHSFMQLPGGMIADRWNPWNIMVCGLGICLLGNLLPFIKPESLAFGTALRAFVGIGTSISFLAMMKVILL